MKMKKNLHTAVMMLLGMIQAAPNPHYLGTPNNAFYVPSTSSPAVLPSACIQWDISSDPECYCTKTVLTNATLMIDPILIKPSFYLKTFAGKWINNSGLTAIPFQTELSMTFEDLFDSSVQVSGSAGTSSIHQLTDSFGPSGLINKLEIYNNAAHTTPSVRSPYLKRWIFTGTNVIGSPKQIGVTGPTAPQCTFLPKGPIAGVKSFLSSTNYFCGVAFAYNTCSCTSALYKLSDNTFKTMSWAYGNAPLSQAWTISNSVDSTMTNFTVKTCGNYLLSPVMTSINGYSPVSIVTDGSLTSTVGNPSSITLTSPKMNGDFNVLLYATDTVGYTITGDPTRYYVTPLYFYVKVVITGVPTCTPAFTRTTQPETPVNYTIYPVSPTYTTPTAVYFTDSNNCGIVPQFSCNLSDGSACPSWITIDTNKKMTVNTNSPVNIGSYAVIIQAQYISASGTTVPLTSTPWVLNVNQCIPSFSLTTQPETPVDYTIYPVSTTFTTQTAIQFTDSNNCGIVPNYSCQLSNGSACPSLITIDASKKMTVNTNNLADIGQKLVEIRASYVSQLGTTVQLSPTAWILNVNECIPAFTPTTQPESPVDYVVFPTSSTFTSIAAIQFTDSKNCGIVPSYSCMIGGIVCPSWISITSTNKMSVNTNESANAGQYTVNYSGTYVSQLGFTKALPPTAWVLNVLCHPDFKLATQPESPVEYSIDSADSKITTLAAIKFADSKNCGIVPQFSCKLSQGQSCPSWIQINAQNKITVQTNDPANIGQIKVNIEAYYVSQLGATVALPPTALVLNLKVQNLQPVNPEFYNILPDFVTPNDWPDTVILECGQAWVQKVPDCQDPNNQICTSAIELGSAIMFAQFEASQRKIYIDKDKLTNDFQGEYRIKVIMRDGIGKTERSFALKVECNSWQQKKKLSNQQKVVVDETPVIPTISLIDNMGKVRITFSERMKPANYTNITNGTFEALDIAWPALAVTMKPYDLDKIIPFTWECTNFTSTALELHLNFTHPNQVSYLSPRDRILITFWGQTYYASQTGKYVPFGYNVTHDVPSQIGKKIGQKIALLGSTIGESGKVLEIVIFVLNLFIAGSLQQLLNQIAKLNIIVHHVLVNLPIPASAQIFYSYLLQIVALDVIPTDNFFDTETELPVKPMTEAFKSVGYESKYFVRNLGSIAIYFAIYPILVVVQFIFGKCSCKPAKKIHGWMNKVLVWNSWHSIVDESCLVMVVSAMIQLLQYSSDDLKPYGRLINFCCAVFFCPSLIVYIVYVASNLLRNFKAIQNQDPETQKFSKLFEELKIRTYFSDDQHPRAYKKVYSGKHTIIYPVWSFLRRLILGVAVTTMNDYPLLCVLLLSFITLISIYIVGTQEPFKDGMKRIMDLFNEFLVLVLNYHLMCFTNFVIDPQAREYLGYSMTVVTCFFIAINLGYAFNGMFSNSCKRVKYWCIRTKNQKKRNAARKKQPLKSQKPVKEKNDLEFGIRKKVLIKAKTKSKPLQNNSVEFQVDANQSRQNVWKRPDVKEVDARIKRLQGKSAGEFIPTDPVVIGLRFKKAYSYLLGPNQKVETTQKPANINYIVNKLSYNETQNKLIKNQRHASQDPIPNPEFRVPVAKQVPTESEIKKLEYKISRMAKKNNQDQRRYQEGRQQLKEIIQERPAYIKKRYDPKPVNLSKAFSINQYLRQQPTVNPPNDDQVRRREEFVISEMQRQQESKVIQERIKFLEERARKGQEQYKQMLEANKGKILCDVQIR